MQAVEIKKLVKVIMHIDVNSVYLSWTTANLLDKGYEKDIRLIPSAIDGNVESRKRIVLARVLLQSNIKLILEKPYLVI